VPASASVNNSASNTGREIIFDRIFDAPPASRSRVGQVVNLRRIAESAFAGFTDSSAHLRNGHNRLEKAASA
jgi:hypothetical protein